MKINRSLLFVLILASLFPAIYFRIVEWKHGSFDSYYALFESLLFNIVTSLIVTLSISYAILSLLHWLNKIVPWSDNLVRRLVLEVAITFPVALTLGYLFGNLAYIVNPITQKGYDDFIFSFLAISGIMNLILVAISDWFYFFGRWKDSLVENERMKTKNIILQNENILAKYEVLKNQINPHFLFNSLSVLSALIPIDPDKAEEFTVELADLYRYILEQYENEKVSLIDEIAISKSYIFLQKIRFNEGLHCEFEVSEEESKKYEAFPLSIQTLLENAIKHNLVSEEAPLNIRIFIENDYLVVTNQLQSKEEPIGSTGIGLQNLKMRYKSYNLIPRFERTELDFWCYLPLFKKDEQAFQSKLML